MTAGVELAGQVILKQGIASSFRPRRYYTIPKETHEAILEDLSQLLDFFVIEFQRILFAENVVHTVGVREASKPGQTESLSDLINRLSLLPFPATGLSASFLSGAWLSSP